MYMSDLRHIHDPVLSSLKMEGIRLFLFHLIVFVHLHLGLPSGLFPRRVPMCISPPHNCATLPLIIVDLTTRIMFGEGKGR
jgi:hypothetical protein